MTFTVSDAALEALQPTNLPVDISLIEYDKSSISWPSKDSEGDGKKIAIKSHEILLLAQTANEGHLILTLSEGEPGAEEPFRLSSFSAKELPKDLLDEHLLRDITGPLRTESGHSLDVIVSIRSGTGLASKFYEVVLQPLLRTLGLTQGDPYRTILTQDAETVKNYARTNWGAENPRDTSRDGKTANNTVILLSGDGGIVDLLNGSPPSSTTDKEDLPIIALVPLGTGNALFHSLHKPHYDASAAAGVTSPSPLVLATRALLRGRAAPLPTFRASFSAGAHLVSGDTTAEEETGSLEGAIVASYGLHSQLVWESDTPAWRKHGAARFGMVAKELLGESHEYRAVVESSPGGRVGGEGGDVEGGRFNYILATMVSNLEKTFAISPAGRPLDGALRLVHFGAVDGGRTMEIMMAAYDGGKHVDMEGVGYEAVDELRITTLEENARWRKVCIDGTIVEIPRAGTVTVRKSPEPRMRVVVLDA